MQVARWIKGLLMLAGAGLALAAAAQSASTGSQARSPQKTEKTDKADKADKARKPQSAAQARQTVPGSKVIAPQVGQKSKSAENRKRSSRQSNAGTKAPTGVAARKAQAAKSAVALRSSVRSGDGLARASFGQRAGLHGTADPLDLKSSVALVIDQDTQQVLFSKNSDAVLPIASITKLMTAMVVLEAGLSLDEQLSISQEDVDTEKGSGSRLRVGSTLSRGDMLHLALMASENRAASALGRHYPGGLAVFVEAMNRKARSLGMSNTRYVEPTGLSSLNQSSAHDLSILVRAASEQPLIRELSTTADASVHVGSRAMQFRNTNGLIRNPAWDIGLQKTGYISEAGRCVVMQAQLAGRKLILVLLDSAGRYSRIGDAERLRNWITHSLPAAQAAKVSPVGG
jgi:D-alanyl-D-alanine endopeptidase (penicillin-binding protein 7)